MDVAVCGTSVCVAACGVLSEHLALAVHCARFGLRACYAMSGADVAVDDVCLAHAGGGRDAGVRWVCV
eukprot:3649613-Rhodomonas_salina.2